VRLVDVEPVRIRLIDALDDPMLCDCARFRSNLGRHGTLLELRKKLLTVRSQFDDLAEFPDEVRWTRWTATLKLLDTAGARVAENQLVDLDGLVDELAATRSRLDTEVVDRWRADPLSPEALLWWKIESRWMQLGCNVAGAVRAGDSLARFTDIERDDLMRRVEGFPFKERELRVDRWMLWFNSPSGRGREAVADAQFSPLRSPVRREAMVITAPRLVVDTLRPHWKMVLPDMDDAAAQLLLELIDDFNDVDDVLATILGVCA
jgi:hypothetical protein